jgi:hypothetical protein
VLEAAMIAAIPILGIEAVMTPIAAGLSVSSGKRSPYSEPS